VTVLHYYQLSHGSVTKTALLPQAGCVVIPAQLIITMHAGWTLQQYSCFTYYQCHNQLGALSTIVSD
jgi:hypothetical protein